MLVLWMDILQKSFEVGSNKYKSYHIFSSEISQDSSGEDLFRLCLLSNPFVQWWHIPYLGSTGALWIEKIIYLFIYGEIWKICKPLKWRTRLIYFFNLLQLKKIEVIDFVMLGKQVLRDNNLRPKCTVNAIGNTST